MSTLEYKNSVRDDADPEDGGTTKTMRFSTMIIDRGLSMTIYPEGDPEQVAKVVFEIYEGKLRVHIWDE